MNYFVWSRGEVTSEIFMEDITEFVQKLIAGCGEIQKRNDTVFTKKKVSGNVRYAEVRCMKEKRIFIVLPMIAILPSGKRAVISLE